ncbi:phytoene desaturase family protein [uncultured Schumannella sp.]|uniref:phytoene desaturase family protein n=1 Tax=uncultured Schumannella sp. TaxID=1195956 RepID=UPI0025D7B76D|nr:phytoene desaturase family protein [uncultured Schumannella sp.]
MSRTIIIGGGIAGLATAALLARDGHEVTVLEQREAVGGRAGSWEQDGFRFDTGPSWYLMPEVFDHFFRLLGTTAAEQFELTKLDPGYRVFGEGHPEPLDIAATREANIALFESVEPGAGAKLARYLDKAKEITHLAIDHFLYSTFDKLGPVFSRRVIARGGRLTRLLTESLHSLAARTVTENRLRQILGYPAVFLGSAPRLAPSMYSLMSHLDLEEGVFYPQGGFTVVIQRIAALAAAEGAEVRTGAVVQRIVVDNGRAVGVEVAAANGGTERLDADLVVSAADLHHTETRLLDRAEDRTFPESYWAKRTAGPSALLLLLGVRGELPNLEHHTLLFSKDWDENFGAIFDSPSRIPGTPSLYVCKPSGVDASVAPAGHENLFVLVPLPADPTIGAGGVGGAGDAEVEALADRVIAQIAEWTGTPDLAERVVVRRTIAPRDFETDLNAWKGTALGPAHTLSQSAFFRAGNQSKKVDGLLYVGGSTIPGIGLPMCLISAELIVKRLRGDTSAGPMPEPLERA